MSAKLSNVVKNLPIEFILSKIVNCIKRIICYWYNYILNGDYIYAAKCSTQCTVDVVDAFKVRIELKFKIDYMNIYR